MKKLRQSKLIFFNIIRITAVPLLLITAFTGTTFAIDSNAQESLQKKISLDIENKAMESVLNRIEKMTNIKFIYSPQIIKVEQKVSVHAQNKPLKDVLEGFLYPLQIVYEIVGNQIMLRKTTSDATDITPGNTPAFTVTGRVTNENKEGIPGVSIVLKGSTTGTATDAAGSYSLTIPEEQATGTLIFSFIGYVAEEVAINNRTTIDVSLAPDVKSLAEVVVIGYGTQNKKELVGSVGTATTKDFGDISVSQTSQLVQGKISGVQVVNNNGLPGAGANIIIRGTGSFTNVSPLYVIDGIQTDVNAFNALSPYDVQDITILKDASSIAIYGARGANGVVMVTTKKGKTGTPKVTYNGYVGFAQTWRKLDLLNAAQYVDLVKESENGQVPAKLNTPDVLVDRTDWQDEIFRTARLTEHHIGVSGGTDKVTYNISTGYTDQQAIMFGYDWKRFNLRANIEENIGKRIRLGQQINFRYALSRGITPNFTEGLRMPPYAPVYDPTNLGGFSRVTSLTDLNDASNPLTDVYLSTRRGRDWLTYSQFYGEIDITAGLTFRSQASLSLVNFSEYHYREANENGNLLNESNIRERYRWEFSPLLENVLTYSKRFGIHNITALVGNTYQNGVVRRSVEMVGSGFPNDEIRQIGVAPTSSITAGKAFRDALLSYFSRVNYSLLDKYILTLSFRRDGSPVFGPNNRFGSFPSAGVAWRISDEDFMKNIPFISDLKVRASWGKSGNAAIEPFLYEPTVFKGSANNILYPLGIAKEYAIGATINSAANPDLKWEETTQTDIGLDIGLFQNRLNITMDFYNRRNSDLLVYVPVPLSTGLGGAGDDIGKIPQNAADALNRGLEMSIGYTGSLGAFKYNISANGSYNHNEVIALGTKDAIPITGGEFNDVSAITRTDVGHPIGAFYGYKMDHVAIDQADVNRYNELAKSATGNPDAVYQEKLSPGDIIFKDLNGDGILTDKDQTYLGSPIPRWTYGGNLNLGYKSFDLMLSLQGVAGVEIVNALNYWLEGTSRPFNGKTSLLGRWREEGDIATIPKAGQNATGNLNLRPSDRFVENGSYMRIRNLTVGYTLTDALLKRIPGNAISNIRVYVTAQNLLTVTKYSGYDPEVSTQLDPSEPFVEKPSLWVFGRGIDNGQYPQPRTFMIGLQVGF